MILNPSYFEGELTIAQAVSEFAETTALQWFINKYEPVFYRAVIGEKLYRQMIDGTGDADNDSEESLKWLELADKTAPLAAMFVYYFYTKNNNTQTTGTGEFASLSESGERKSPWTKRMDVWNEMVDSIEGVTQWICDSENDYQDFAPDVELFLKYRLSTHENLFGI
jgi:hypothetical protein